MPKPEGRAVVDLNVNVENEQLIIASMMHHRILMRDLSRSIASGTFMGDRHKVIFSVLQEMAFRHLEYSTDTFIMIAGKRNYGGRRYLEKLFQAFPHKPKNMDHHVETLRVDATKYHLRTGPLQELMDCTEDPKIGLDQISGLVQSVIREVSGHVSAGTRRGAALYERYLADMRARRKSSAFVPTYYDWLDENLVEGLARKKLSVWTSRPSMGKSTFGWNVADRVANRYGGRVGYFALEMDEISVMDGIVSSRTGIDLDSLVKLPKELTKKQLRRINDCAFEITNNQNLVFWEKGLTIEKLARVLAEDDFAVVIIDLYEKMIPGEKTASVIDAHLDQMQTLAKESDTHFALIHQTRRGVEKRRNKRPTLEDLKNSGKYEEAADLVLGFYREQYYDPDCPENVFEVGILKQRRGARLGWQYFEFDGKHGKVGDEVRDWASRMYDNDDDGDIE